MNTHRLTALLTVLLAGTCIAKEPVTAQGQDSTAKNGQTPTAISEMGPKVIPVLVQITASNADSGYEADKAMDDDPSTFWSTHCGDKAPKYPHDLTVDLGTVYKISGFSYLARQDSSDGAIQNYEVLAGLDPTKFGEPVAKGSFTTLKGWNQISLPSQIAVRYVVLRALAADDPQKSTVAVANHQKNRTSVAEWRIHCDGVKFVNARANMVISAENVPKAELGYQYQALIQDLRKRKQLNQRTAQTFRQDALIADSDRDPADVVLRRTNALFAHLASNQTARPELQPLAKELETLRQFAQTTSTDYPEARYQLYERICQVRRKIAFANPLLNFDEILFIARKPVTFAHCCDQFYGVCQQPGGGLMVLTNSFGSNPSVRNALSNSVVANGRLAGKTLTGGAFTTPALSFDARRIAFAYVECTGKTQHDHHTDSSRGHWDAGRCLHVFSVNLDGSDLRMLTDGTWNDFDPCFMPSGRIAFISERRGGYLRCGRTCPTYTLFDMAADGSDIRCLSYHETNEWNPSVTHDGRIIWTRWDYIDRDAVVAHMPWITTSDGRDPRSVHGNFSPRNSRPDMETNVRAIPGSHRFIATAAPHHGESFGSLVIIDPSVKDDDRMGPLKRVTPDCGFPESQEGIKGYFIDGVIQDYGQAWPLSEDFYLSVHSTKGAQNYGLYLVDSFGNKELIYRDPSIHSQCPIPVRARPVPPIIPEQYVRAPVGQTPSATVSVLDVYQSLLPWPEGTKITALRVIQVLPLPVACAAIRQGIGRDGASPISVINARAVLGTVPVESDGSAHFTVPAGKEIFFQALDANGLAIQSMRSGTHTQPGERLTCVGCHDQRHKGPPLTQLIPLAMRRPPSVLKPDADGTNPFSYPRLVQPVLDRNCVACHAKNAPKAPLLDATITKTKLSQFGGSTEFFTSYVNLVTKYGYWNYNNPVRTIPGVFGAKASKLYELLQKGHHDVKLSPEDLHRLTVWLDCISPFYGDYAPANMAAQIKGEVVKPTLE